MKFLIIFFLAVTVAAALKDGFNFMKYMNAGHHTPAALGQFPYQVFLRLKNSTDGWYCGGSLISSTWVLTAAHCTSWASSVKVFLGVIEAYRADLSLTVDSSNIINHEDYDNKTLRNDIALIKIPPVEFTNNIKAIKLPRNEQQFPEFIGENLVVSEWAFDEFSEFPGRLKYEEIKSRDCFMSYGQHTSRIFCDTPFVILIELFGDFGGPLVWKEGQILIGVASFRTKRSIETVFTRVSNYLDWIAEKTGIKS